MHAKTSSGHLFNISITHSLTQLPLKLTRVKIVRTSRFLQAHSETKGPCSMLPRLFPSHGHSNYTHMSPAHLVASQSSPSHIHYTSLTHAFTHSCKSNPPKKNTSLLVSLPPPFLFPPSILSVQPSPKHIPSPTPKVVLFSPVTEGDSSTPAGLTSLEVEAVLVVSDVDTVVSTVVGGVLTGVVTGVVGRVGSVVRRGASHRYNIFLIKQSSSLYFPSHHRMAP